MKAYKIIRIPGRVSVYAEGKYQLKYPVGSIVSAPEGTLGIMCFSSREHLLKFIRRRGLLVRTAIIEVEGMGGALFPTEIAWLNFERYINKFYKLRKKQSKSTLRWLQNHHQELSVFRKYRF